MPAREFKSYVVTVRLLRGHDNEAVGLVHPRSRIFFTRAEKIVQSLILQAEAISV